MLAKVLQFIVTFFTIRQIVRDVEDEGDRDQDTTLRRRPGTDSGVGAGFGKPTRDTEDTKKAREKPSLEQVGPNSWVHNPPIIKEDDK